MAFVIGTVEVRQVVPADRTYLERGTLYLDEGGLVAAVRVAAPDVRNVRVHVVEPGSATRILCVKDVVQPRVRVAGSEPGSGRLHALSGIAVATCGPIVGFQEGIIDMGGPGAAYTQFSSLQLVVLEIEVDDALEAHAHEAALRTAGIRAARHLAECSRHAEPDKRESFDSTAPCAPDLPRLGYVYLLQSQGLLHDTYVLGESAATGLPRSVSPEIVLDDTIVSGNCVSACDKNTTYHHQNNPVVRALFDAHGSTCCFAGVVLSNEPVRLSEKSRAAEGVVALGRELRWDGAIVSKEGFGNPDADLMMIVRGLEGAGIRTVAITDEYAGRDGASQSLADATAEADAVISTGNANELIELPPMARTIGPSRAVARLSGCVAATDGGALSVELQVITGATNELGFSRLRAFEV